MRKKPSICADIEISTMATQPNQNSPDIVAGESRIDRMRKFLSSPLTRKKVPNKIFGTPLEVLIQKNPMDHLLPVPFIVSRLCQYIEAHGLGTEGLFRISGNSKMVERLRQSFEQGGDASLETEGDVAAAAALLKLFLRELPEPLIPAELHRAFLDCASCDDPCCDFRALLTRLPLVNYHLLKYLTHFLATVAAHEEHNRMGASALGIVFGPNLFRVAEDMQGLKDQSVTNQVVTIFISHYHTIFEGRDIPTDFTEPLTIDIPPLDASADEEATMFSPITPLVALKPENCQKVATHFKGKLLAKHDNQFDKGPSLQKALRHHLTNTSCEELSPHSPKPKRREIDLEPPILDPQNFVAASSQFSDGQLSRSDDWSEDSQKENQDVDCPSITDESQSSLELSSELVSPPSEPTDNGEDGVSSEHRFSWPILKGLQDDATLSPFPRHLRKTSSLEAPLSPSAGYLSLRRGPHLDPNLPPSPPVEQEPHFTKGLKEEESTHSAIRQLTKKIHSLKKKVRQFEEGYEANHGFRPSYAEKITFPDVRKHLSELARLRKELKGIKEGSSTLHSDSSMIGSNGTSGEDKPSIEDSFKDTLAHLAEKRRLAQRPEDLDAMDRIQVGDEKIALQKALLKLESVHGRPSSRTDRELLRPLYDRYRTVKRILGRSVSGKDTSTELQPILEHVAMDFAPLASNNYSPNEGDENAEPRTYSNTATFLTPPDLHELSLQELVSHQQQARIEKHRLRRILHEFESQFHLQTGKKVQKEDRAPMEEVYSDYKHVKAHLKLLEALLSKRKETFTDPKGSSLS